MLNIYISTTALASAFFVLSATALAAQTTPNSEEPPSMASACFREMNEFAQRMYEDEFWLTGWGSSYGQPPAPQSTATPATPAPAAESAVSGGAEDTTTDPRGEAIGVLQPRYQIRSLYSAGRVLAHRGDEEGCEYIVSKMNEVYDDYSRQLREAGVDPTSVTTWRQEQLALAEPLQEGDAMNAYRIDDLTGTDVRNARDEALGSVSDIILDAQDPSASFIIVARGGFMGLGEYYAIPWNEIRLTPGLQTVVVDMTAAELEQAPSIDPNRFRNPQTINDERRTTDQFWTERS